MSPFSHQHPYRAAALMCLSAVLFGFMAITIRLASHQLHAFEIAFFRNFFGLMFALPLLWRAGIGIMRTDKLRFYFLRCFIGLGAMLTGFWALVHMPLAQAISLSYSTPLFVTIGAVLVLGEIVRIRRWTAVFVGFIGVIIIVRPGADSFSLDALIALSAAALSASAAISIKFLSRTEHPYAIVVYMVLIMTPLSLLPAIQVWHWPDLATWGWLVLTGLFGTTAHVAMTRAYQLGDLSALTPLSFVQLPVVALLAWLLFDEGLDRYTAIGATIIFASNVYIARRESQLARPTVTAADIGSESQAGR